MLPFLIPGSSSKSTLWTMLFAGELVRFGRHYEVVAVQATDLVRPPRDGYPTPLGEQRGMVPFLLGPLAHPVGERQRPGEVAEPKDALQPLDALPLHQLPARHPLPQLPDFRLAQRGFAATAG